MPVGIFLSALKNRPHLATMRIFGFDHLDPLNRIATVVTLGLSRSMQNQPPERSPDNPGR